MSNNEPLYNLEIFRQLEEEDPGALQKIVSVFMETTPGVLSEINNAYQQKQMKGIAQYAHKLKATIDILSITSLAGVIRKIEQVALANDPENELPGMIEMLNSTLELVFIQIKEEIN